MPSLAVLVQALGVSYAAGINLYATVAVLGIAQRLGWVGPLPGGLDAVGSVWVIALASGLYVVEFLATLVPGIASLWETAHSLIRPPAAVLLAATTAWGGDGAITLAAALLGGGLAVTTHGTKLGLRYAVDTSPEPVTNGAANLAELGVVIGLVLTVWQHPYLALVAALVLLVLVALLVRAVWRTLRRFASGDWSAPGRDARSGVNAGGG